MFKNSQDDETVKRSELCIQELQRLEKERKEILEDLSRKLNMTPEEISNFCNNPDNFPPDELDYAKRLCRELEENLQRDLANIQNPIKSKKNLESLKIPSYAIFVR